MFGKIYNVGEKIACVEEFKNSDLTLVGYARQINVPPSTFRGWLKQDTEGSFGKIDFCTDLQTKRNIIVFTSENIRIELKPDYDKNFLRKIIEVLIND